MQMLHANPERFYSVTQIGITLMSLALGAIGIATFTEVHRSAGGARSRASRVSSVPNFRPSRWLTPWRKCSPS